MELDSTYYIIFIVFYLVGSIPFALIVYKFMSTADPRKSGSMNPGATNMYRIAGPLPGIFTFLGDFLKGFIPRPAMCFGLPIPDLCKMQGLPIDPAANMTPFLHFAEKISDFFVKIKPMHLLFENNNLSAKHEVNMQIFFCFAIFFK